MMVLGGCAGMLAACSASTRSLTIDVRDAQTKQPARAGIGVVADVPSVDHPFSIATLLGETGPISTRGETDGQGRAKVEYVPGRPFRLVFIGEGVWIYTRPIGVSESRAFDGKWHEIASQAQAEGENTEVAGPRWEVLLTTDKD